MPIIISDKLNDSLSLVFDSDNSFRFDNISSTTLHTDKNSAIDKNALLSELLDLLDYADISTSKELYATDSLDFISINQSNGNLASKVSDFFCGVMCHYADKRKHWILATSFSDENIITELETVTIELKLFLDNFTTTEYEGFIAILEDSKIKSDTDLAKLTKKIFIYLETTVEPNILTGIEDESWRFIVENEELYLLAFSNHYPPNHSRHLPIENSVAFLIQPDRIFNRYTSAPSHVIQDHTKAQIRERYAKKGTTYNSKISESLDHKIKFVKSTNNLDIIKWWQM